MTTDLITKIVSTYVARENCRDKGNMTWAERHTETLTRLLDWLPSGSGFDAGSSLRWDLFRPLRVVFETSFHHMSEHGYYTRWTEHQVIVTPTFGGFDLRVTGQDRNGIKEYIAETFHEVLSREWEDTRCHNTTLADLSKE